MSEAGVIRVATFNIQHGAKGDYGKGFPELVASACQELEADIIGLQEVDVGVPRSQKANLAKVAAEACGMDYRFAKARTFRGRGQFGNALLASDIDGDEIIRLNGDRHTVRLFGHRFKLVPEPRNILVARVAVNGFELSVGVSHIGGDNRRQMLGKAAAELMAYPGPHVLLVDANLKWQETQNYLEPLGLDVIQDQLSNIDHIAVSGLSAVSVNKYYPTDPVSDHIPVVADLVAA